MSSRVQGSMATLRKPRSKGISKGKRVSKLIPSNREESLLCTIKSAPDGLQIPAKSNHAMDITPHTDARLPYRVGFPTLLVLPVKTETLDISKFVPKFQEFYSDIRSILSKTRVKNPRLELAHRFHKRHRTDKVTLIVSSDYELDCQTIWIEAVKALHEYLLRANLPFIIEIVDSQVAWETPMPKAIDTEDETFFKAVEELKPMLIERMALNQHAWLALDVLKWYSVKHGEHRPAFVITALDADSSTWWEITLPWIRARIAEHPCDIGLELYYLEAITFAMDTGREGEGIEQGEGSSEKEGEAEHAAPHASMLGFYDLPFQVGTSCGLSGSKRSGTWGGRILLKQNGQDMELGLTNSHVVLHDFLQKQESKGPFRPGTLPRQDFVLVSPSDHDHAFAFEGLKQIAEEASQRLNQMVSCFGEAALEPSKQSRLERFDVQNRCAQIMANQAETFNREIGSVFAASGYTTRKFCPANANVNASPLDANWALDWALFDIDKEFRQYDKEHTLMMWQPIDPNKNYQIRMQGRTSGKGTGRINAVASKLSYQDGAPIEDASGTNIGRESLPKMFGEGAVTAHCLTAREKSDKYEVIRPGDSGSLILADDEANQKTVYGLAFAGNEVSNVSYMIPAQLLVEDIRDVTGGDDVRFIEWR